VPTSTGTSVHAENTPPHVSAPDRAPAAESSHWTTPRAPRGEVRPTRTDRLHWPGPTGAHVRCAIRTAAVAPIFGTAAGHARRQNLRW
jgi:hypothetical protein